MKPIQETNLNFTNLVERNTTDLIVLHHTGEKDIDATAEQIHGWHLNNGWAGIGYHFVVRKDGSIERGRPEWAIGSHAYGHNSNSIGIHLSGDFDTAKPTTEQLENCTELIAFLCKKYNISCDRKHIVAHGELMSTACPGKNIQSLLDAGTITGKANYYLYGSPKETAKTNRPQEEIIWNFFKNKGLTDFAVAGIMGNLYAESGLISNNLQNNYEKSLNMSDKEYTSAVDNGNYSKDDFINDGAGFGIAQWTFYTNHQ